MRLKPKLLTRLELAKALPADPRSVSRWIEEGMPIAERGRGGHASLYSLADVEAWRKARETTPQSTLTAARIRREQAMAAEAEQRVLAKAGNLITIDDVEKTWGAIVAAVRSKLLALPTALSDRLHRAAVTAGAAGVETILQAAIYDTLRELADDAPVKPARSRKTRKARTVKKAGRADGAARR